MAKSTRPAGVRLRPNTEAAGQKPQSYFIASALAIYKRGDEQRQRHMNVLLEQAVPAVNKDGLAQIQRSAVARLSTENGVEVTDVQDVVILSISFLGVMSPEAFAGTHAAAPTGLTAEQMS